MAALPPSKKGATGEMHERKDSKYQAIYANSALKLVRKTMKSELARLDGQLSDDIALALEVTTFSAPLLPLCCHQQNHKVSDFHEIPGGLLLLTQFFLRDGRL